jgi:hypothetical protein
MMNKILPPLLSLSVAVCAATPSLAFAQAEVPNAGASAGGGTAAAREGTTPTLLSEIWPAGARFERLSEIGRGKGVVFSPDLSVPSNRGFYEKLGFAYFEGASWREILGQVRAHNLARPAERVEVLIIESHGTNGNGLKLQAGQAATAPRSYVSVGALQENLEGTGVRLCVITACNAGRLFRPAIYRRLNPRNGDPLFLPATRGIVNASPGFTPAQAGVKVIYPVKSSLETSNEGDASELSGVTRSALGLEESGPPVATGRRADGKGLRFVVSDILVQMLLHDPRLRLSAGGYVVKRSSENFTDGESEGLVQRFFAFLDEVARRERHPTVGGPAAPARDAAEPRK